jgi:hypothetical protein
MLAAGFVLIDFLAKHWVPFQYLPESVVVAAWTVGQMFVNSIVGYLFLQRRLLGTRRSNLASRGFEVIIYWRSEAE